MFGRFTKGSYQVLRSAIAASLVAALAPCVGHAQEKPDESSAELSRRVTELSALVQKLEARVDELEGKPRASSQPAVSASSTAAPQESSAPQGLTHARFTDAQCTAERDQSSRRHDRQSPARWLLRLQLQQSDRPRESSPRL
jgi:outer membrane murein-binding lipoprotein Lpp